MDHSENDAMVLAMHDFIAYCEAKHNSATYADVQAERDAYRQLLLDISEGTWAFPQEYQAARRGTPFGAVDH